MRLPNSRLHLVRTEADSPQWGPQFVELQLKQLRGEDLTDQEAAFIAGVELLEEVMPGVLEETLLGPFMAEDEEPYRVAASSAGSVYDQVIEAVRQKLENLSVETGGEPLPVLRISAEENLVEPVYQEGYTFLVQRPGGRLEEVTRLGGLFLGFDELRSMRLAFEPATRTIRLSNGSAA
jgi:hypothetical protein